MNIENLEHWHFELTEKACNDLLELVLQGKRKQHPAVPLHFGSRVKRSRRKVI